MWRQAYTDDGFDLTAKLLFAEKSWKKKNNNNNNNNKTMGRSLFKIMFN